MSKPKIIITGGHITPALALIEMILSRKQSWEVVFVGREKATEQDKYISEEKRIISSLGIRFIPLNAGRLRRFISLKTIISFFRIPLGLAQSLVICLKERPDIIVSFGGYIGLPVALSGFLCGAKVAVHEQTDRLGLANRIASPVAKRIFISWPGTQTRFPDKTIYTGLPVRKNMFRTSSEGLLPIRADRKLIYILGGVTGSDYINRLVYEIISKLVLKYQVVHQTGRNWISQAKSVRQGLRGDKRKYYIVEPYLDSQKHSFLMDNASLIISRSGINTVFEIAVKAKVALLIPLSVSAGSEQFRNAARLAQAGSALVLKQGDITPKILKNKIDQVMTDMERYQKKAQIYALKIDRNGTQKLFTEIEKLLEDKPV